MSFAGNHLVGFNTVIPESMTFRIVIASVPRIFSFDYTNAAPITILWGDGKSSSVEGTSSVGHSYAGNGTYDIAVFGEAERFAIGSLGRTKLVGIINSVCPITKLLSAQQMFYECTNLTEQIPDMFFDRCQLITSFLDAFSGCSGLLGPTPVDRDGKQLWERVPAPDGIGCFTGCTGLSNFATVPANWK